MSRVVRKYENLIAFHPGYYLRELIESLDMTRDEFSRRMGVSSKTVSEIVNGNQNMSIDIADRISNMTGTSIDLWLNLQKEYDKKVLEIENLIQLEEDKKILKQIDFNYIKNMFDLDSFSDINLKIKRLKEIFQISSLNVLKKPNLIVSFRNPSGKFEDKNVINSNIMLQIAKEKAKNIEVSKFNKKKLIASLNKILSLNLEEPEYVYKKLSELLRDCGIAFVLLPHLKNSGINGAVTKINKNKIMLLLSDRNKYADIFWFSLFHELGHIINGDFKVSMVDGDRDECESKADEFAKNRLIDQDEFKKFIKQGDFSKEAILNFSNKNKIQPGILLGRLQAEKFIKYGYLNYLKTKYKAVA